MNIGHATSLYIDQENHPISSTLIAANKFCDYIPIISTAVNIVDFLISKLATLILTRTQHCTDIRYPIYINEKKTIINRLFLSIPFANIYFAYQIHRGWEGKVETLIQSLEGSWQKLTQVIDTVLPIHIRISNKEDVDGSLTQELIHRIKRGTILFKKAIYDPLESIRNGLQRENLFLQNFPENVTNQSWYKSAEGCTSNFFGLANGRDPQYTGTPTNSPHIPNRIERIDQIIRYAQI